METVNRFFLALLVFLIEIIQVNFFLVFGVYFIPISLIYFISNIPTNSLDTVLSFVAFLPFFVKEPRKVLLIAIIFQTFFLGLFLKKTGRSKFEKDFIFSLFSSIAVLLPKVILDELTGMVIGLFSIFQFLTIFFSLLLFRLASKNEIK